MAIMLVASVLEMDGLKPAEKLVLMALANYADEHNRCYPSFETIAQIGCMSLRSVHSAIKGLEAQGLVSKHRRHKADGTLGTYIFTLHISSGKICKNEAQPAAKSAASPAAKSAAHNLLDSEPVKNKQKDQAAAQHFEGWWQAYPRKVAKGQARRAYLAALKKTSPENLRAGLERYRAGKPDFADWCYPATWLNGERWADELGKAPRATTPPLCLSERWDDLNWARALETAERNGTWPAHYGGPQHCPEALQERLKALLDRAAA